MYLRDVCSCLSFDSSHSRSWFWCKRCVYALESIEPSPPEAVGYDMWAGERREPSSGVVGPETEIPDGNERSVDNEGDWETLGVLYMPSNSIPVKFLVDWKGRESDNIVESFLHERKDKRKKKMLGIHKEPPACSHLTCLYLLAHLRSTTMLSPHGHLGSILSHIYMVYTANKLFYYFVAVLTHWGSRTYGLARALR